MRRFCEFCILALAVLLANPAPALSQIAKGADTSKITTARIDTVKKTAPMRTSFKATQLIAPSAIVVTGVAIHCYAHETWDYGVRDAMARMRGGRSGDEIPGVEDYLQYFPLLMDLGLGFTGVKEEHQFVDRCIETAFAMATYAIILYPTKAAIKCLRPNEANWGSFPSAHTAIAFTAAELVRKEYGWGWGAGAYAVAASVGFMRMYRNWHWLSDVLVGAGIGIFAANVGCWLLEPFKRACNINLPDSWRFGIAPTYDPQSRTFCACFNMTF